MRITIENRIDEIPRLINAACGYAEKEGASEDLLYTIRLSLEEIITNTIKYGYDREEIHTIDVIIEISRERLKIEIIDDANPFDPVDHEYSDNDGDMDDWEIGGLGIHMVRQVVDVVEYHREESENRLMLIKNITGANGT